MIQSLTVISISGAVTFIRTLGNLRAFGRILDRIPLLAWALIEIKIQDKKNIFIFLGPKIRYQYQSPEPGHLGLSLSGHLGHVWAGGGRWAASAGRTLLLTRLISGLLQQGHFHLCEPIVAASGTSKNKLLGCIICGSRKGPRRIAWVRISISAPRSK
jgi:hypothetical protein